MSQERELLYKMYVRITIIHRREHGIDRVRDSGLESHTRHLITVNTDALRVCTCNDQRCISLYWSAITHLTKYSIIQTYSLT